MQGLSENACPTRGDTSRVRSVLVRAGSIVLLLSVVLSGCSSLDPGTSPRSSATDGVVQSDALLERFIEADGPGCSAAVAIDGEIAWAGQQGLADLEGGTPIGPETRFDFASVSKQFTGLTILRLVEAGELRLEDSIGEHLDGLPTWSERVTIEQLLHHTSGIPDYTTLLLDAGSEFEDTTTQADALAAIGRADLQFSPGDRFAYSNSNYVLLASIAEAVTGESFDAVWADIYRNAETDPAVRAMAVGGVDAGVGGTYAAGLFVADDGTLSHNGGWAGFVTLFGVSADRSTVIVVACNTPDLPVTSIASGLRVVWS